MKSLAIEIYLQLQMLGKLFTKKFQKRFFKNNFETIDNKKININKGIQ